MSEETEKTENKEIENAQRLTRIITYFSFFFGGAVIWTYAFWFGGRLKLSLSNDATMWGAFGDYVGGLVNPIVGLATLFIVANAFLVQRKELSATVSAMRETAEEQKQQSKHIARQNQLSQLQQKIDIASAMLSSSLETYRNECERYSDGKNLNNDLLNELATAPRARLVGENRKKYVLQCRTRVKEAKKSVEKWRDILLELESQIDLK